MRATLKVLVAAAALLLSLGTAAQPTTTMWNFSNVQFDDGTTASGWFSFDTASGRPTSWLVRTQEAPAAFPGLHRLIGFTYVPGNSSVIVIDAQTPPAYVFRAQTYGSGSTAQRDFRFTPSLPLTGTPATVPLLLVTLNDSLALECFNCGSVRREVSGELHFTMLPPAVALVTVVEYYNASLAHYFITADGGEIAALDGGLFPGWARTGQTFLALRTGSSPGNTSPVCRYYGRPEFGLDTHFYSASALDCQAVRDVFDAAWIFESDNEFQIDLPDTATGACAAGRTPVYRLYNNLPSVNHRYTTSLTVRADMIALGWISEGFGPNGVVMCAFT